MRAVVVAYGNYRDLVPKDLRRMVVKARMMLVWRYRVFLAFLHGKCL
jgi:hypothetical protein